MPPSDVAPASRRLLVSGALAGAFVAAVFVAVGWGRLLLTGGSLAGTVEVAVAVLSGGALVTVSFAPFLVATLAVVASGSPRSVATGIALVYGSGLLLTVGQSLLSGVPVGLGPTVLAVPFDSVVSFLGVATAVWLAHHGGYERLLGGAGTPNPHPLLAAFAGGGTGPGLALRRGVVVAGIAALVGVGGLVLAGAAGELLRAVARAVTPGSTSLVFAPQVWRVGIPLGDVPSEWLFEASFLLAVLFVTGARVGPRDVLGGIAVIVGVQSTVTLLPALFPPFRPVDVWEEPRAVLAPLGDAILFLGIAVAVWLAFHGGLERLREVTPSEPLPG